MLAFFIAHIHVLAQFTMALIVVSYAFALSCELWLKVKGDNNANAANGKATRDDNKSVNGDNRASECRGLVFIGNKRNV